jgi:putative membrane protein
MMRWYGWGWGGWFGMGIFWLLLLALIVWLVVQLARPHRGEPPRPPFPPAQPWQGGPMPGPYVESPFETLDRRLASGEIDLPTYQQLRQALIDARGGTQ